MACFGKIMDKRYTVIDSFQNILKTVILMALFLSTLTTKANTVTKQLQGVLNSGSDLVLEKGKVYEIDEPLRFTVKGQQLYTENAMNIRDFATIRIVNPEMVTAIIADGIANIEVKHICVDGNRHNMRPKAGKVPDVPFISLGRKGGDDQIIKECIITNARCAGGWAAIHIHEYGMRTVIENNIIFGSGTDVLGNGRSSLEHPLGWGDGISVSTQNSVIRNNLIIDATDEGIMVQGAAGSHIENNVVVALSREVLMGIALVEPKDYCLLDKDEKTYDYRGIVVQNNLVHALGARVHIGYPCGKDVWNGNKENAILVGASVINNKMIGNVGGYGFAASGIKNFIIKDNITTASFEERGDGLPNNPPDDPAAFIYEPLNTFDCQLQEDFIPAKKHIVHLLRNSRPVVNESGYRLLSKYGKKEAVAIINTAFMEILDRNPSTEELTQWNKWLQTSRSNADAIRTALMISPEFNKNHASFRVTQLQECRVKLFLEDLYIACEAFDLDSWPAAVELHSLIFERYN